MSANGASDHRAFGSLFTTCQGALVESKSGSARTLVQEQGSEDVLLLPMGQVLTVEVVTEVMVIVIVEGGMKMLTMSMSRLGELDMLKLWV
jgi:hypothetical protein